MRTRTNRQRLMVGLALMILISAGCAGAAPPAAESQADSVAERPSPTPPPAPTDIPTVTPPDAPTATDVPEESGDEVEPAAEATRHPDLASEPAPPGAFRWDRPSVVGATGRPQLLEFFTEW